jgi:hypothetical protein
MRHVEGAMEELVPVDEHHRYALLWDLADEIAKQDHRTAEECWLAIMDAFWGGKLSTLFVFCPRKGGRPGRALKELPPRSAIAYLLLGPGRRLPAALRGWTIADYAKQPIFGDYCARNPPFGLAIRRADFDRWRAKPRKAQEQTLPPRPLAAGKDKPKRRSGPKPGTVRRHDDRDRALFPELEDIMATQHISTSAAARVLDQAGRIGGAGAPESRARRLQKLYAREKKTPA